MPTAGGQIVRLRNAFDRELAFVYCRCDDMAGHDTGGVLRTISTA